MEQEKEEAMRTLSIVGILGALAMAEPAYAEWGVGAGYTRYHNIDESFNLGDYGSVGVMRGLRAGPFTLYPGLAFEYAPDTGFWGLMVGGNADYPVGEHVGLDLTTWFWNDLEGTNFGEAAYYFGGGIGSSFFVGSWTISPSVNYYRGFHGGAKNVLAPGLAGSYTF